MFFYTKMTDLILYNAKRLFFDNFHIEIMLKTSLFLQKNIRSMFILWTMNNSVEQLAKIQNF